MAIAPQLILPSSHYGICFLAHTIHLPTGALTVAVASGVGSERKLLMIPSEASLLTLIHTVPCSSSKAGSVQPTCDISADDRMFNWVVRVVPQPPDPPGVEQVKDKTCVSNNAKKTPLNRNDEEQNSLSSNTSNGVLTWLSNGFVSALPQPTTNSDAKLAAPEDDSRQGGGVIGWISQGLGKVVPQPDVDKYKEGINPAEDETEVFDEKDLPDAEPLPHIPVVELFSDEESEIDNVQAQFPPKVIDWLKNSVENAIPQHRPGVTSEPSSRRTSPCSEKVYSPPPESITSANDEDSKNSTVVAWIMQGLGHMMPQPMIKGKENGGENGDIVIQNGGRALRAP